MSEKKKNSMDFEFIERVVRLVEEAEIGELEVEGPEGLRLVVKKVAPQVAPPPPPMYAPVPAPGTPPMQQPAPGKEGAPAEEEDASLDVIKAPMVGTFYRAPSPDSPPYVDTGQKVEPSTIVCILEAMKVMNEIKAGMSGTIVEILAENGQPVEYGQPLFKIKK